MKKNGREGIGPATVEWVPIVSSQNENAGGLADYTGEDVMQALVAALTFGEDAGLAALASYDSAPRNDPDVIGCVSFYVGGGSVVELSPRARDLLADAYDEAHVRAMAFPLGRGLERYDLTRGAV